MEGNFGCKIMVVWEVNLGVKNCGFVFDVYSKSGCKEL